MKKRKLAVFFIFIYLLTVSFSLKNMTAETFSGENLTALCLESSLPSITLAAAETESERDVTDKPKEVGDRKPSKRDVKEKWETEGFDLPYARNGKLSAVIGGKLSQNRRGKYRERCRKCTGSNLGAGGNRCGSRQGSP